MRSLFFSLLGYFLTPAGLVLLGVLDGSIIFFLPLGIDAVVVLMAARTPHLFWLYAILAASGSLVGAAGTFWIGKEIGEHGLAHFVSPRRLKSVKKQVNRGAALVAALAVIPPPFPFTAFVLSSGAFDVNWYVFFPVLFGARLVQYGIEGMLGAIYGRQIVRWMQTPTFVAVVGALIVLAIIGTVVSAIAIMHSTGAQKKLVNS
ncbi:MAG: VTT domain-containing protein [Vicinamibacterales bacterium]